MPTPPAGSVAPPLYFTTQALKNAEVSKAFSAVRTKHPGSSEAVIAATYLGAIAADEGKLPEAEKYFQAAIADGDANYGSVGKLSLAQILVATGRVADAEKMLRSLWTIRRCSSPRSRRRSPLPRPSGRPSRPRRASCWSLCGPLPAP